MKLNLFFGIVFFQLSMVAQAWKIETRMVPQPIDHFDVNNKKVLKQRVQIAMPDMMTKKTPIIFVISGEGGADINGYLAHFAEAKQNFILMQADHRGYNASMSSDKNQSMPTYITVKQALADFNLAITNIRNEAQFKGRPLILVGFSYAGGLAVQLAADHPQVADVVISSSGVLDWPFTFNGHDKVAKKLWPQEFIDDLAKRMDEHAPEYIFDQKWHDREFLQGMFYILTQYQQHAHRWVDLGNVLAGSKSATDFFNKIKNNFNSFPSVQVSKSRGLQKISYAQAKDGSQWGRFWAYQQCFEMGAFFTSADQKLFAQTADEYRDYCESMFGFRPTFEKKWNMKTVIKKLKVPLISVVALDDPWYELGLLPSDAQPARGKYIVVPDAQHIPDHDPAIMQKMLNAAFAFLP